MSLPVFADFNLRMGCLSSRADTFHLVRIFLMITGKWFVDCFSASVDFVGLVLSGVFFLVTRVKPSSSVRSLLSAVE